MASPPHAYSPAGSPPYSSAPLPSKKRASTSVDLSAQAPSMKRRKASIMSTASTSSAHPLRQTSFPPDESQAQGRNYSPSFKRSPSVDNMSFVSGSQASGAPGRKKRGRKSKAERASEAAAEAMRHGSPSVAGGRGRTARSIASGLDAGEDGEGEKDKEEEFEIPENMASVSNARTAQQIKEQLELNAFLKEQFDPVQFARYETWHRSTFRPQDVKRVSFITCPALLISSGAVRLIISIAHQQRYITILPSQRSSDDAIRSEAIRRRSYRKRTRDPRGMGGSRRETNRTTQRRTGTYRRAITVPQRGTFTTRPPP